MFAARTAAVGLRRNPAYREIAFEHLEGFRIHHVNEQRAGLEIVRVLAAGVGVVRLVAQRGGIVAVTKIGPDGFGGGVVTDDDEVGDDHIATGGRLANAFRGQVLRDCVLDGLVGMASRLSVNSALAGTPPLMKLNVCAFTGP